MEESPNHSRIHALLPNQALLPAQQGKAALAAASWGACSSASQSRIAGVEYRAPSLESLSAMRAPYQALFSSRKPTTE